MSEIPDSKIEVTPEELEDWRSDALLGLNPSKADKRILTLIGEVKRLRRKLEASAAREAERGGVSSSEPPATGARERG